MAVNVLLHPAGESSDMGRRVVTALSMGVAGVFIALGMAALVTPDAVIDISRRLVSPAGIHVAAALRLGLGLSALLIARESRAPGVLRLMGCALLIAGLLFPVLGVESAKARIEWEAAHLSFLRLEGALFVWAGWVVYKLTNPP